MRKKEFLANDVGVLTICARISIVENEWPNPHDPYNIHNMYYINIYIYIQDKGLRPSKGLTC
jgi:hypothetical protein